jgi:ATP-dependent helicase HrpA
VAQGVDLDALREEVRVVATEAVRAVSHPLERSGLVGWPGGDLPDVVEIGGPGSVRAFPALVDEGDTVGVRLFANRLEQRREMWRGTRRLLVLQFDAPASGLRSLVTGDGRAAVAAGPYDDFDGWLGDCVDGAVNRLMLATAAPVWTEGGFSRLRQEVRAAFPDALYEVASTSLAILDLYRDLAVGLDALPDAFEDAALDMAGQVNRLVYPGFVSAVGSHLDDVRRYLEGVAHRMQRVREDPARDRDRMARVRRLEDRYDHLVDVLPPDDDLVDVGWRLQELRMALFAQSLGVVGTVSEKRLAAVLDAAIRA